MNRECCGTCRHCRKENESSEWICVNDLSDYYAVETEYGFCCEKYEERE